MKNSKSNLAEKYQLLGVLFDLVVAQLGSIILNKSGQNEIINHLLINLRGKLRNKHKFMEFQSPKNSNVFNIKSKIFIEIMSKKRRSISFDDKLKKQFEEKNQLWSIILLFVQDSVSSQARRSLLNHVEKVIYNLVKNAGRALT